MAKFTIDIDIAGHDDAWPYEDVASVVTTIAGAIRNGTERGDIKLGLVDSAWRIVRQADPIRTPRTIARTVPLRPGWETDRSGPPDSPVEAASRGYGRSA